MYFIYNIYLLDYYTRDHFNNLCCHIKILLYDAIKVTFNDIVKFNINDIISICKNNNLDLFISFSDNKLLDYINILDFVEITDVELYKKVKNNFKKKILNINLQDYNNIELNIKDQIIINNIDKVENLHFFENNNKESIGIEIENYNDIWFNMFKINIFSVNHKNNIINSEWSLQELINDNFSLSLINYVKNFKKIIITGVSGQDGSLLAEYILSLDIPNTIIMGTIKCLSVLKNKNLKNIVNNKNFCPIILDLIDYNKTELLIKHIKPNYFINCAAQTTVYNTNNINIENTFLVNTIAPLRHLDFIKNYCINCRYLSCGSSEEFGEISYTPQDLNHPYKPNNIYGITKNTTHNLVKFFRNNYNLHCSHMVLYNHESTRRSLNFVTRKITNKIAQIKIDLYNKKIPKPLQIGNIYSKRDWSCSNDFVKAFWKIVNMDKPDDYILSSGKTHTIKELINIGFKYINIDLNWIITKDVLDTKAYYNDILLVEINKDYYRKNDETRFFQGNNMNTIKNISWENEVSIEELVCSMIDNDIKELSESHQI